MSRQEAFQNRGGIEKALMAPKLPSLAERMSYEKQELFPENPEIDARVQLLPLVIPFDGSMRYEQDGSVWVSFGRPSQKKEDQESKKRVLRWAHAEDIDSAIRMFKDHIVIAYGKEGEARMHIVEVVKKSNEILDRVQSGRMTMDDLEGMEQDATRTLYNSKFFTSYKTVRRNIADTTVRAVQVDSTGRINPPRTRLMVSQTREGLVRELFYAERIKGKNRRRGIELVREREYERLCLETFRNEAEALLDTKVGSREYEESVDGFLRRVHWLLSPRAIKVKPYSPLAAKIRFQLFGKSTEDAKKLTGYIGEDEARLLSEGFQKFGDHSSFEQKTLLNDACVKIGEVLELSAIRLITPRSQLAKVA